jgi:hypothetical protein
MPHSRRLLLTFALAVLAVGLLYLAPAGAKPKPVKPGAFLTVTCPAGTEAHGGTVTWLDKRGQPIGTSAGVVTSLTVVRFGPAPKGAASAEVTALDCRPPPTTTTVAPTTTSTTTTTLPPTTTSTTTTTVAPTTTTLADPNLYLTGSGFVTDQGLFLYGDPSIPGVQHCPTGYVVSFAQSTFIHPPNIEVFDFTADFDSIIAIADLDTTGTISWRIACRPVS